MTVDDDEDVRVAALVSRGPQLQFMLHTNVGQSFYSFPNNVPTFSKASKNLADGS